MGGFGGAGTGDGGTPQTSSERVVHLHLTASLGLGGGDRMALLLGALPEQPDPLGHGSLRAIHTRDSGAERVARPRHSGGCHSHGLSLDEGRGRVKSLGGRRRGLRARAEEVALSARHTHVQALDVEGEGGGEAEQAEEGGHEDGSDGKLKCGSVGRATSVLWDGTLPILRPVNTTTERNSPSTPCIGTVNTVYLLQYSILIS